MFDFLTTYLKYPIQTATHELWGLIVAIFCLIALFTDNVAKSIACIGTAFLITYSFIQYEESEFLRIKDLVDKDIANFIFLFIITLIFGLIIKWIHGKMKSEPLVQIKTKRPFFIHNEGRQEKKDVRDQ